MMGQILPSFNINIVKGSDTERDVDNDEYHVCCNVSAIQKILVFLITSAAAGRRESKP